MKEFVINKTNENQRFDKYLKRILPAASNAFIYKMLRKKNIELNEKRAKGDEILKCGDKIKIYFSDETYLKMSSSVTQASSEDYSGAYKSLKGIEVVFEHEDFMIVYKPSGILSQKNGSTPSLNEWCLGYLIERNIINEDSLKEFRPSVLNRLDFNTEGLVICSKTLKGSQRLSEMLNKRTIKKYYHAVCQGHCDLNGVYKAFLSKDSKTNKVSVYDNKEKIPSGIKYSPISTGVKVLSAGNETSELEIELITGKSHQIRAHLSYLGFPLIGDIKYNSDAKKTSSGQELKAYKIVFPKFDEKDEWYSLSEKTIKC